MGVSNDCTTSHLPTKSHRLFEILGVPVNVPQLDKSPKGPLRSKASPLHEFDGSVRVRGCHLP